ncbi:MAG: NAD-dependent epimerase/dehydratase family protein [Syntrophales bacterium]
MNRKKQVLVVGAAGFIGTYLIDELRKAEFRVLACDVNAVGRAHYRKLGVPFEIIDVTKKSDMEKLPKKGIDAVVNLACVQPANVNKEAYDPIAYVKVNVIGTLNLLEYCRTAKVPQMILATSHRNTKGLWKKGKRIREDEGRAPDLTGEYAMFSISESAAEDCVEYYSRDYGLRGIVFRFPPVYGYGPHTIIFKDGKETTTGFQAFIDNAVAGKPIELWGDPNVGRDIIYVKDAVGAFVSALRNAKAKGLYNISSGRALSLRKQAEETLRVFGSNEEQRIVFRPQKKNSIDPFLYDNAKAKRDLGWSPRYTFRDLLVDYQKEMECKRFHYLVKKRQQMLRAVDGRDHSGNAPTKQKRS